MLKILGRTTSINVRKVLWTCAEIGVDYEREDWGRGFRSASESEFVALNPNALIPVIIDDGFVLWESNAICRYLAKSRGRLDLLPDDAQHAALVDQWMDWQTTTLGAVSTYAFHALARKSPDHADGARLQESVSSWIATMPILEAQLAKTGAYVVGDSFTLADIVLGLAVNRWFLTPFEKPVMPAVRAYYERLLTRPGFLENGPNGLP